MHNVNPIIKVLGGSGKCSECSTLGGSAKFKSWLENAKVKKEEVTWSDDDYDDEDDDGVYANLVWQKNMASLTRGVVKS